MSDLLGKTAETALRKRNTPPANAQARPPTEAEGAQGLNNEDTLVRKDTVSPPSVAKETVLEKQLPLQGASSPTSEVNILLSNPFQENSTQVCVPNSSLSKDAQSDVTECSNRETSETSEPSAIVPKAVPSSDIKQSIPLNSSASDVRASPTIIRYVLEGESSVSMTVSDGKIEFSLLLLRSLETRSCLILLTKPTDRYIRQDCPEERICEARICERPAIPGAREATASARSVVPYLGG